MGSAARRSSAWPSASAVAIAAALGAGAGFVAALWLLLLEARGLPLAL